MQPICLVSRRRSGPGSVVTPRISRVITPAPLSNVTRGGTRIRPSSPPPPPKMVILVQRPFERVLSRGLTVAVYSSLFDRSKSKRMDPSQEQKKNIHIYIYTSGTRIYSWWVPVQIVTSLTVLLVLPIRISSPSLSPYSDIFARVRICEPDDMS